MDLYKYLEKMKQIQKTLLEFIEQEDNLPDQRLISLKLFFNDVTEKEKADILKEILLIISQISGNHHRTNIFNDRIEKILLLYKAEIKQSFSDKEIFNIFKKDKKVLLFLFKEGFITVDRSICNYLSKDKDFYSIEINSFYGKEIIIDDEFIKKRQIGENDNFICQIIRDDSVIEFIKYTNQTNLQLTSEINCSIFETNPFLIEKTPSLIEYAAFFGSIQIAIYLINNNVRLTESVWLYAIHSQNSEMIFFLEENYKNSDEKLFQNCFIESVKCHHNEIADYFIDNILKEKFNHFPYIIPYYNYKYFNENNDYLAYNEKFIQYNYVSIVKRNFEEYGSKIELNSINYQKREFTPLLGVAVENENIEITKFLIKDIKDDVNKIVKKSISPYESSFCITKSILYLAVETDNDEIIELVFPEVDFEKDYESISIFYHDENYHLYDCINQTDDTNPNYQNTLEITISEDKTVLSTAVENGNKKIVKLLLENENININEINKISKSLILSECSTFDYYYKCTTPLSIAVEKGDVEMVKLLLQNKNLKIDFMLSTKVVDISKYRESDSRGHHRYYPDSCDENEWTIKYTALDIAKKNNEIYSLLKNALL